MVLSVPGPALPGRQMSNVWRLYTCTSSLQNLQQHSSKMRRRLLWHVMYCYLTPLTELPTLSRAGEKVAKPAMPGITVSTSPLTNQR